MNENEETECTFCLINEKLYEMIEAVKTNVKPAVFCYATIKELVYLSFSCAPNEKEAMKLIQMAVDDGIKSYRVREEE